MSTPVPLGVRIFNTWGRSFDVWVTNLVSDIQFRSVIPGGYANATLTLHNDQSNGWTQVAQPLNRIQIVDLRSQEIAWEGRIDTVPRQTSDDTWELGCLGSMAVASDIQRPYFAIDGDIRSWRVGARWAEIFPSTVDEDKKSIEFRFSAQTGWTANLLLETVTWQRCEETDLRIGRFDITYAGGGTNATAKGRFASVVKVTDAAGASPQDRVDVTTLSTAKTRKANAIGAAGSFTSTSAQRVVVQCGNDSVTVTTIANSDEAIAYIIEPRVQVQLVDETGTKLTTAASYPTDYLTIPQIVKDVVGRFLVKGWNIASDNSPYPGQVRATDSFIDTSSTAQITNLTYYDGVTAAEVFNDLITAQPEAFWAIWESNYGATADTADAGYRFEWATWPSGWAYEATSIDGLEEQPDGGGLYNFLFYTYPTDSPWETEAGYRFLRKYFGTSEENQLLTDANLVRAVTVQAEEPQSSATSLIRAGAKFAEFKRTINTGTLTVKRPIQAHDAGLNSNSGVSRMLDPWLIRPGKLIRITDIPPRSNSHTFAAGADAVIDTFDGRTTASGWGSAISGQAWTNTGGSAADYSVSGGFGRHSLGTVNVSRFTTAPSTSPDFDIAATIATDKLATGDFQILYLLARFTNTSNYYMANIGFGTATDVVLTIRKNVAGTETHLGGGAVAGLVHAANRRFAVRFQGIGSAIRAKIWQASGTEPDAWTVTVTDTALTEAGSIGCRSHLPGTNTNVLPVVATFDNLTAIGLQTYAPELDGTVFRVVGTTYSSADNSCVLELDQPPAWNTPTQVLKSGEGSSNLVVRG